MRYENASPLGKGDTEMNSHRINPPDNVKMQLQGMNKETVDLTAQAISLRKYSEPYFRLGTTIALKICSIIICAEEASIV